MCSHMTGREISRDVSEHPPIPFPALAPNRAETANRVPRSGFTAVAPLLSCLTAGLLVLSGCTRPGTPSPGADGPSSTPVTTPADPHGQDDPAEGPTAAPGEAPKAAARFAKAWARPRMGAETWWKEIAPLCEPGFAARLRTVDPGNIPATRVTGTPRVVVAPAGRSARYAFSTDAGTLLVTVADLGGTWLVSGNDLERTER